jgi:hypothetical protein
MSLRGYIIIVLTVWAVFVLPIIGGLEWLGRRLGATIPLTEIAQQQRETDKLLWLGAFKDYAPYKLERIRIVHPEILLVGSSRCGQAREQMFRPYKAYNACLTAWPLEHVVDFVDRSTRLATPRVVILALDYFLFNDFQANAWRSERPMDYSQGIASHWRKLRDVIDFAIRTNFSFDAIQAAATRPQIEPIDGNRLIGTEAIRGSFGFRTDGSIFVAPVYRQISADELARGAQYLTSSFGGGAHLSEIQFQQVERLSELAHSRGFSILAIQYPFLTSAVDVLETDQAPPNYMGLWHELGSEATARRLANLGIRFFDMSHFPLASEPGNFVDPAHPTERATLQTIIALMDRKAFSELFPRIDKHALEADLNRSPKEPFDLYH